ncbi:hypothetical protein LR48_Vigan07g194500 [Vigna angularis]|uniref:Putative plant transposon protein domain-containing protein n=1 Tax=Phaseolus angularis TaxID=3914 RepID=A0A0L9UZV9_PHAAN|nr:hypothetical protein LR48_Vigan07g194500 [Vigna angularis]
MALSSGSKRIKTIVAQTERGKKRKEQAYSNKFLSHMHERHFEMVQNRRELGRRQWEQVASYPAPANIVVAKEFYTNARSFNGDQERYTIYVRGKRIPYDADTINTFLGTEWTEEQCQFASSIEEDINYAEMERTLCIPRGHFQRNRQDVPIHNKRSFLTPLAQYWMAFTHANIQLCSHVSDITTHRVVFIYCVLKRLNINEDFLDYVAWPSDQAQPSGGAGMFGVVVMKEDEEEDDEEDEDEDDDEDKEEDDEDDEDEDDSRG